MGDIEMSVGEIEDEARAFDQGDGAVLSGEVGERGVLFQAGKADMPAGPPGDVGLAAGAVAPERDREVGEPDQADFVTFQKVAKPRSRPDRLRR